MADLRIIEILRVAGIEKGTEVYLTMLSKERAERNAAEIKNEANAKEEEAKRFKMIEERKARLVEKLALERKEAIKKAVEAEKNAYRENLIKLKTMYGSMEGYQKQYNRVQQMLWKLQAKEYAKTGLIAEEAAYAGIRAKETTAAAATPTDAAVESVQNKFVGLAEMWKTLSTTASPIERKMETLAQRQLAETKETNSILQQSMSIQKVKKGVIVQ